jgi:hypothetical protein
MPEAASNLVFEAASWFIVIFFGLIFTLVNYATSRTKAKFCHSLEPSSVAHESSIHEASVEYWVCYAHCCFSGYPPSPV